MWPRRVVRTYLEAVARTPRARTTRGGVSGPSTDATISPERMALVGQRQVTFRCSIIINSTRQALPTAIAVWDNAACQPAALAASTSSGRKTTNRAPFAVRKNLETGSNGEAAVVSRRSGVVIV